MSLGMKYLHIQLQPDLNLSIDKVEVKTVLSSAGYIPEIQEGDDNGPYINFNIQTNDLKQTWQAVYSILSKLPYVSSSAIVACGGDNGWDDYLLLYHYDKSESVDEL